MKKASFVILNILTITAIGYFINVTHAQLKYLEKKKVTKAMIQWNKALGVKCTYCHTSNRTQTYESLVGKNAGEKELNALVRRRISRAMMGFMSVINEKENKNYTCNTCHQGKIDVEVK